MTCGELIEYLSRVSPEEPMSIVVIDLKSRLRYGINACHLLDDDGKAALLIETDGSEPMDEVLWSDEE